jgi:hypothetical protein
MAKYMANNSEIEKEICAVADYSWDGKKDRAAYLAGLIDAVDDLDDKDWSRLSSKAQKYYNAIVDAMNAKADYPWFPDAKAEEPEKKAEAPTRRRRATKDDDDDDAAPNAAAEADTESDDEGDGTWTKVELSDVGEGERATVVLNNDNEYEGDVVKVSDSVIILDVDGEERKFSSRRIEEVLVLSSKGKPAAKEEAAEEEEEEPAKPVKESKPAPSKPRKSATTAIRYFVCANPKCTLDDVMVEVEEQGLKCAASTAELTVAET